MMAMADIEASKNQTTSSIFSNKGTLKLIFLVLLFIQLPILLFYKSSSGSFSASFDFNITTTYHYVPYKPHHSFYDPLLSHNHDNLTWIDHNPIYSKYNIPTATKRKRITVLIVISTAPRRFDRRQAIRETFWKECVKTKFVKPECIFITDTLEPNAEFYNETQSEAKQHGDLKFQNLKGGVQFGERLMYHFLYGLKNYEFDYFLRMDDDYFLCMNNFLQELPVPMKTFFHWGWCHQFVGIMRPEESMILFSRDVILAFLHQDKSTMKCHPLADQMVAQWTTELNMRDLFRHDGRLHHEPIVKLQPDLLKLNNVCKTWMGIHGSYPSDMRTLYSHRGPIIDINTTLQDHTTVMESSKYGQFNWRGFGAKWQYEPKLCINNPVWNTPHLKVKNGAYGGRQETKKKKR